MRTEQRPSGRNSEWLWRVALVPAFGLATCATCILCLGPNSPFWTFSSGDPNYAESRTRADLRGLTLAFRAFVVRNPDWTPADLRRFCDELRDHDKLIDIWGQAIELTELPVDATTIDYRIRSSGKDCVLDTTDDLTEFVTLRRSQTTRTTVGQ